jgi:hypothetical protein
MHGGTVVLPVMCLWFLRPKAVSTLQTGYHHIPASSQEKGQGVRLRTAMCPTALNPASLEGGPRSCHTSRGFGPRLPTREGSGAVMRHVAPEPLSLLARAPLLPRFLRLRTQPPC